MSEHESAGWSAVRERLRQVAEPPPLSEIQLARIARRVFAERSERPRTVALMTAAAMLLAVAALLLGETRWRRAVLRPARQPIAQAPAVPSPPVAPPPRSTPPRMAIAAAGRLALHGGSEPMIVAVPDGQVTIEPGALVEIEVHQMRTRLAVYRGQASVRTDEYAVTLTAGHRISEHGIAPVAIARARQLDAALDETLRPKIVPSPLRSPTVTGEVAPVETVATPAPAPLSTENVLLAEALKRLSTRDYAGALLLADEHAMRFPAGALAAEVALVRAEALAGLHRRAEALAAVELAQRLGAGPRDRLALLQGELAAEGGNCDAAGAAYTAATASSDDELAARAHLGQARCHLLAGHAAAGRAEIEAALRRHPDGAIGDAARRALAQ